MATLLGSETKPTDGQAWYGASSNNKMAKVLTMPPGGTAAYRIVQVGFWAAGKDASPTTYASAWHANGTLIGVSASFAMANLPFALGNSVKYTKDVFVNGVDPVIVDGGQQVYVGWQRAHASAHQYGTISGPTHCIQSNGTVPGGLSCSSGSGDIGAFLYYEANNQAPNAPQLISPIGGSIITGADLTPDLTFKHTDPDSDDAGFYQIQVDNNSDFSSPTWDSGKTAMTALPHNTNKTVACGVSLSRGTTYYWRAKVWDDGGLESAWGT
jgi:hypothetical protein